MAPASRPPILTLRAAPRPAVGRAVGAGAIGLFVLVWWAVTYGATPETRLISPVVLSSPGEVVLSFPSLLTERALLESIAATLRRVLAGFGLAVVVGVPLGILAGAYRVFDAALAPIALVGRNVPVAALIPLTILWFGIEETQKTMFIFLATAPFVFSGALDAVVSVHERYVESAQTLGASPRQVIAKVLIALSLPSIYNSLRNLFGLAFGYIMLAELINAKFGLGYLLSMSQRRGLTEHIILILLIIGVLAYAIDRLLYWFQLQLFPYQARQE